MQMAATKIEMAKGKMVNAKWQNWPNNDKNKTNRVKRGERKE